jgi:hypothetical protein
LELYLNLYETEFIEFISLFSCMKLFSSSALIMQSCCVIHFSACAHSAPCMRAYLLLHSIRCGTSLRQYTICSFRPVLPPFQRIRRPLFSLPTNYSKYIKIVVIKLASLESVFNTNPTILTMYNIIKILLLNFFFQSSS